MTKTSSMSGAEHELFAPRREQDDPPRGRAEEIGALRAETAAWGARIEALETRAAARDQEIEALASRIETETVAAIAAQAEAAQRLAEEIRDRDLRPADEPAPGKLAALEDRLAEANGQIEGLKTYARTLEIRYLGVLESNSWRLLEPGRRIIRRLTGKRTPAPFVPRFIEGAAPERSGSGTKGKTATLVPDSARKMGASLIELATRRDYVALVAREKQFAGERQSDQNFFLARFCRLVAMSSLSAFSEVARVADEMTARLGKKNGWIVNFFGKTVYGRYVSDAAMALTRVGRYEEARRFIDDAVDRLDRSPAMLQLRAEVCWPYDCDQALEDIAECGRRGGLNSGQVLMQAYLEAMVAGRPIPLDDRLGDHPQMPLIAAALAVRQGDFATYKARLNGYFEAQGLLAPLPPAASRFAFAEMAPETQVRRDGPLVSVVMTTYDSEETVEYAVASLRRQTHGNLEIFIVDDCSSDGTRAKLEALQAADDRVQVLFNEENVGTYCSKNRAIARAKGDYVTMHDSDDWAHPERVARHVEMMERSGSVVATRSDWLRLEPDGTPNFRRWGRRFQHPNPASVMFRREVFERIGFFDSVRFGADSEFWYRMRRVYGGGRVKSLPLCLGLGSIRADSLTRSGDGAMDQENYSPVRGAYAASYFYWHATAAPATMKLPPRLSVRPFSAPSEMVVLSPDGSIPAQPDGSTPARRGASTPAELAASLPASAGPEFMFGISLASAQVSSDWARTQELLGQTLRSLLNQSDPNFTVVICGHERPELPELADPRIRFVESDQSPPKGTLVGFRGDKMRKRRIIGSILRERGGGYFFPLDADDLVHREVVAHVRRDDNRRGYLIESGLALDYNNRVLAPIPGAWSVSFDRACGSSAVLYFTRDELPIDGEMDPELYFNLFQSHAYWPIVAEEYDRRLDTLPFPGGVYVVNHAQNLSFRLQRKGPRTENVIRSIAAHRIEDAETVLKNFGVEP